MAKQIRKVLTYDAPLADVHAMLLDPAFREEVTRRMHVIRASARTEPAGSATRVVIDQVQHATGMPSFVRKLSGDEVHIVQEETWTSPDHADVHVSVPHKPGEMGGTADLTEADGVTTEVVVMEIRVRVPLVGGKIESFVGDMLLQALEKEQETGRDYLAGKLA